MLTLVSPLANFPRLALAGTAPDHDLGVQRWFSEVHHRYVVDDFRCKSFTPLTPLHAEIMIRSSITLSLIFSLPL
jgi:hypothetical protein